jgi:hypothetical protein
MTTGVFVTSGKLSTISSDGNIFPEIYIDRGDTGGELVTGVVDTGCKK